MRSFAWSWSKLKNYRTCPKRHWHVDLKKDFQETESEALQWGNFFHKAMEERVEKSKQLPLTVRRYEDWGLTLDGWKQQGVVKTELKLAFDKHFRPTNYFDNSTWYRSRIDVAWFPREHDNSQAVLLDWKTGDVKPDSQQLALSAQTIFAHYPQVDHVVTSFVWIGNDAVTTEIYKPDGMVGIWNGLLPEVQAMEEAHRTTTYPPKPSGLCKRYCPVESCPYFRKGSY